MIFAICSYDFPIVYGVFPTTRGVRKLSPGTAGARLRPEASQLRTLAPALAKTGGFG